MIKFFILSSLVGLLLTAGLLAQNDVLVLGAPRSSTWGEDVVSKIESNGTLNADFFNSSTSTPTLVTLNNYDVVFLFTDIETNDPMALGDILGQYLDGGNGVVDATFTANVTITGGWTFYELYSGSGQSNGVNLGIGTVNLPGDPLMSGINSFDGGDNSYHNTDGVVASGAQIVAEYTTGAPFIIKKENVGPANVRRVFLNFFPPSIDVRPDFWVTSSDGALIMINALSWVIDPTLKVDENDLSNALLIAPNPAENQVFIGNKSNIVLEGAEIFDISGRRYQSIQGNALSEAIDVSDLSQGMYFISVTGAGLSTILRLVKK